MTSPPNDTSLPGASQGRAAGLAARNVKERALVFIVVFLGFLIVAGLVAVVARIIYLSSTPVAQRAVPDPAASGGALPSGVRLDLPSGAVVKSVSVGGDRLAVHYDAPGGTGIAVLDLATGAVLQRVDVVPGGTAP